MSLTAQQTWEAALGQLQLQVARPSFETWLRHTRGLVLDEQGLIVGVPTSFGCEWLEKRMSQIIESIVQGITRLPTEVHFEVLHATESRGPERPAVKSSFPVPERKDLRVLPLLNARYTFNSFVVGSSNQLAHAAATAVAAGPGTSFNPLFIYAGTGLGKTHLLHAIAQETAQRGLEALYVSSERFTNDFISSIRDRRTREFRNRYLEADILLIDDIQFISGKEQTQEGFFHIFNDLHNASRQIVLTSDRPPKSLALLEDRLRSRFGGGLIADIQPPDLETRLAILETKALSMGLMVNREVLSFIAHKAQSNVRDLEGFLNRVVAVAQLSGSPISKELVATSLAAVAPVDLPGPISPHSIVDTVANYFGIPGETIIGNGRDRKTTHARSVAIYIIRMESHFSLYDIGQLLGNRDPASIRYSYRRAQQQALEKGEKANDISNIIRLIHR